MDPQKIGIFIKELRKKNNLTQKDLADKYNVTYQAVSKWENGINLPDVSLIRQMCKDFNIQVEELLDGKLKKKNNKSVIIILTLLVTIVVITTLLVVFNRKNDTFSFKNLSSNCTEFRVSGSIAYDKDRSSIYISKIDYCGGNDTTNYKNISCSLYEKNADNNTLISTCSSEEGNIKLEEYLRNVELKIDNYNQVCKKYNNDSLYLEINATKKDNNVITYKIPLDLNNNC